MKIGIIAAMQEEAALLKDDMIMQKEQTVGGRSYFSGKLYGKDTTLVFSRWGKVASASTVTTLIVQHQVDCIIFTGVAGAVSEKLNIGDIIIPDRLYQHDMDARPLYQKHEIPLTGEIFFNPDPVLFKQAIDAVTKFQQGKETKLHIGAVASGDQFISSQEKLANLKTDVPDVLAVEMEGAAIAQVCSEHTVPFVVIRIISDNADHTANIDFQRFVNEVARYYSRGIIKNLYESTDVISPLPSAVIPRGF